MRILVFVLTLAIISLRCNGQSFTNARIDSIVGKTRELIDQNYAVTQKAKIIHDSLVPEMYYGADIGKLVLRLNEDFYRLSKDKHLAIQYSPTVATDLIEKRDIHTEQNAMEKEKNFGFSKDSIINKKIGYLRLDFFADTTGAMPVVEMTMSRLKNTEALILDLRHNPGGSGKMIQLLAGYFLPDSQTDLLAITYNSGNKVIMKAASIDARNKYLDKPMYVLCDSFTFSAAEALAFILKNRDRAIIVGSTSPGAGNVAGPYAVDGEFVLTIPVGTITDTETNTGWEGVGVTPDVFVESSSALDKAIMLLTVVLKTD